MRMHAYGVSFSLIAAALYPAFLEPSEDGFPLSTYPMFARDRGETVPLISALARGPGFERPVPPGYVATGEVMQALQTLRKTVRAGPKPARALCRAIAQRVAAAADPDFAPAREIRLVTRIVDPVRHLRDEGAPLSERVHARCPLPPAHR